MNYRILLTLSLVACCFNSSYAQFQGPVYLPNSSIKVYAYNTEKTLAWCGGFNNPQIQTADLNNDHLADLVVYERDLGVRTFLNKGTAGNPVYVYSPQYAANFPFIDNYMILRDYNCDNVMDLFYQGGTGFAVATGYYNAQNQLCFRYFKNLFYNNDTRTNGWANAYNNITDIPSIVDVDNDGDLDFLSYNIVGGNINYYKNMRVEMGYPCDSIVIKLVDNCWGKVYQAYWRTHILQYSCDNSTLHKDSKVTHTGNAMCLFDYDGDGDYDYLDGSISFNEMTFLKNGRIPYKPNGVDSMVYQDTLWQSNGTVIELPLWPAAYNIDVDQDGKKDLVITPNAANTSENYKCIWYYKNESTPGNPSYVFQSDSFLVDKSIDLGTAAYPTLFDYNKDGKPDLFIGSDGFYQSSGTLKSKIAYYLNTSTTGAPSFTLQTNDFLSISGDDFLGAAIAMGDLDNDGKQDMVIGHTDGTLSFFSNTAASDAVQPNWQLTQQTLKIGNVPISVNNNAAPFIYDINKDGKPDLLIGSLAGGLTYYENVSTTPGVISLKFITSELGGVAADPATGFGGTSTPFIGKVDNTGKDYLLLGSNSGKIYRFDGFQNGNVTTPYTRLDSIYSYINNTNYVNLRSAPTVADIDGDGKYEMFVGMIYGGVQLYKQDLLVGITNVNAGPDNQRMTVYPNPASNNITIGLDLPLKQDAPVSIINIEGQQLLTTTALSGLSNINIPLGDLPAGVYVCIIEIEGHKYYNKFTVLK